MHYTDVLSVLRGYLRFKPNDGSSGGVWGFQYTEMIYCVPKKREEAEDQGDSRVLIDGDRFIIPDVSPYLDAAEDECIEDPDGFRTLRNGDELIIFDALQSVIKWDGVVHLIDDAAAPGSINGNKIRFSQQGVGLLTWYKWFEQGLPAFFTRPLPEPDAAEDDDSMDVEDL